MTANGPAHSTSSANAGGRGLTSIDPATGLALGTYPASTADELDAALDLGMAAYQQITALGEEAPRRLGDFLDRYASLIESQADDLTSIAHAETALPLRPRLVDVELPRTTDRSWRTSPTSCPSGASWTIWA